ncbi:hypothetical protein DLM76_17200 [Leptospira yasudae]|uniref:hypothetical protein n=1 Tax=Leptospira yasudae TaxID=2202201 RepID=UPI000E59AA73|nr:hypothetical protein [Leptospira yasudae]RHX91464.1 hypothetical protein DLM76_17200 [Leptospira yasudae]
MLKTILKNFNQKTWIGIAIGAATFSASNLAQNFVPESLDTKKKLRPIAIPIVIALISAFVVKKNEYKPYAFMGAFLMLILGILKLLDEEKSTDKKIANKVFGVSLSGDRQEIQFDTVEELQNFANAISVNGEEYAEVSLIQTDEKTPASPSGLYGDTEDEGRVTSTEEGLAGDEDSDLFGDEEGELSLSGGMV